MTKRARVSVECIHCGKEIVARSRKRLYCDSLCQSRANRYSRRMVHANPKYATSGADVRDVYTERALVDAIRIAKRKYKKKREKLIRIMLELRKGKHAKKEA